MNFQQEYTKLKKDKDSNDVKIKKLEAEIKKLKTTNNQIAKKLAIFDKLEKELKGVNEMNKNTSFNQNKENKF